MVLSTEYGNADEVVGEGSELILNQNMKLPVKFLFGRNPNDSLTIEIDIEDQKVYAAHHTTSGLEVSTIPAIHHCKEVFDDIFKWKRIITLPEKPDNKTLIEKSNLASDKIIMQVKSSLKDLYDGMCASAEGEIKWDSLLKRTEDILNGNHDISYNELLEEYNTIRQEIERLSTWFEEFQQNTKLN